MSTKVKIMGMALLLLLLSATSFAGASLVDQRGVMTGSVYAGNLAVIGTTVQVGTPLVMIETPVGPVPATRANVYGIVREVLVHSGDMIHTGDVLVRIEPVPRK